MCRRDKLGQFIVHNVSVLLSPLLQLARCRCWRALAGSQPASSLKERLSCARRVERAPSRTGRATISPFRIIWIHATTARRSEFGSNVTNHRLERIYRLAGSARIRAEARGGRFVCRLGAAMARR